jgi:hypothetical protein
MVVTIPAGQVEAGHLPHVCARHGEQAIEMKKIRLVSKPPPWTAILIFSVILYVIVVTAIRKKVLAPAWPWCAKCKAQRSRNLSIGLGGVVLGFVLLVAGAGMSSDAGGLLAFLGFVLLLVGLVFAVLSNPQQITSAIVSRDGNFVEVKKASDGFAQALQRGGAPQVPTRY